MLDMIDGAPVLAAIFGLCSNRWKVDVVLHRILDGLRDKGMVKGATEEEEERDGTVSRARGKRASAVGREGKMQTRKKVSSKRKGKQGDSDSEGAEEQDDGVRPKVRWLGSAAEWRTVTDFPFYAGDIEGVKQNVICSCFSVDHASHTQNTCNSDLALLPVEDFTSACSFRRQTTGRWLRSPRTVIALEDRLISAKIQTAISSSLQDFIAIQSGNPPVPDKGSDMDPVVSNLITQLNTFTANPPMFDVNGLASVLKDWSRWRDSFDFSPLVSAVWNADGTAHEITRRVWVEQNPGMDNEERQEQLHGMWAPYFEGMILDSIANGLDVLVKDRRSIIARGHEVASGSGGSKRGRMNLVSRRRKKRRRRDRSWPFSVH
jgi:hypothetical protein